MRVAHKTIFQTMIFRLGKRTEELAYTNNVVSTGKAINNLSDDPVGLTRVLDLKASIANMDQVSRNLLTGRSWLQSTESSLSTVRDIALEVRTLTLQMTNDSVSPQQRTDAAERINGIIQQVVGLGNTVVSGKYIFGGNRTDDLPFVMDDEDRPGEVTYLGDNDPFTIKLGEGDTLEVGSDGSDIFWEDYITVDSTNNMIDFEENIGDRNLGKQITNLTTSAGIPVADVDIEVKNSEVFKFGTPMPTGTDPFRLRWNGVDGWDVTGDPGFGLPATVSGDAENINIDINGDDVADILVHLDTPAPQEGEYVEFDIVPFKRTLSATIPNGTYTKEQLAQQVQNAMNEASTAKGNNIAYDVSYDPNTERYTIKDDGGYAGYPDAPSGWFSFTMLWDSGENKGNSIGPDIGFSSVDVTHEPIASDTEVKYNVVAGVNDRIDVRERVAGVLNPEVSVVVPAGIYTGDEMATAVSAAMSAALVTSYTVEFDADTRQFNIQADAGVDETQLLWNTGTNGAGGLDRSIAKTMGFDDALPADDDTGAGSYTSDSEAKVLIQAGVNDSFDFAELPEEGIYSVELHGNIPTATATIPPGYYLPQDLASAMETELEAESRYNIDYSVSYNLTTRQLTIKEDGVKLKEFQVLWATGNNAGTSMAGVGGFLTEDDTFTVTTGDEDVEWGLFNTLIDLRSYLENDDQEGTERSLSRLDTQLNHLLSEIADVGQRELRIDIKESIILDLSLNFTERRSDLEDADMIEALADLQLTETAYEAALLSSSRIMQMSLVDFL